MGAAAGTMEHRRAAYRVPFIILYYSLCSSTLIVINKVAIHNLKAPVSILLLQLAFSALSVKLCAVTGLVEAEKLRWGLIKPFVLVVLGFLGTLYANIKVLMHSNVETFITFRSSTPLLLSLCDYFFLGREFPRGRSVLSLLLLLVSCAGYTHFDKGFKLEAYGWLCVWYFFCLFETCYVKHICDTVSMTNWGRVYYQNALAALVLVAVFPICKQEHKFLAQYAFTPAQILLLLLSCAVGAAMSHASFLLRSNVSATGSVVVGIVCKLGSVLINLLMWDQHASPIQLLFLLVGLGGGCLFQQAPLRKQREEDADGYKPVPSGDAEAAVKLQQPLRLSVSGGGAPRTLANKRESRT